MPKIDNSAARVQEMLKSGGAVDQITKKLENILNGNLIVKKAEQDGNGSNIVDTYATKDEVDIAFLNKGIYSISIHDNGSVIFLDNSDLDNLSGTGLYKLLNQTQSTTAWLFVVECPTGGTKTRAQFLIDTDGFIYYRSEDMGEWRSWTPYATQEDLNRKTEAFETIELKTTNIGSLTVSSELTNLIDTKLYKIKCSSTTEGWLFITRRGIKEKTIIQTIIDFDGNIYHRYLGTVGWSDWVLIPDSDFLNEILEGLFDERGIRQPDPIPSYDELTEHGIYSLDKGLIDNEYVFSVHSPVSSAEITQYRFNSKEGLLKRTYIQNMETGEYSWSDWNKYISTENIDTALSETSINPVQNKVVAKAFKSQGIQLKVLSATGSVSFISSLELNDIDIPGIYKLSWNTGGSDTGWLIVSDNNSISVNINQTVIDQEGTIYVRRRGTDFGEDPNASWSEWIKYVTQDIANNTYLSKTDAQNTYLTKSDAAATYLLPISPRVIQFIDVEAYDDIIAPGIYKNEHNIETTWLIVSQHDSAEHDYTQIKITSLGVIGYRYHNPSDSTWSNWIYYSTQEEIKPKISMWKPNTHYYVDDTVIALDPDSYYYIATCKTEHISSNIDSMFMGDTNYWTIKSISSKQSFSAIYAENAGRSTQAEEDADGNIITATYATKAELHPTPITSTTTAITANNSYNYGEQTELSIAFPAVANDGDVVYITFTSGATATVLTIDTTNTSDIELIPEANTGYEIYAKYNGTIWIVNYSDYTVTAEAGA